MLSINHKREVFELVNKITPKKETLEFLINVLQRIANSSEAKYRKLKSNSKVLSAHNNEGIKKLMKKVGFEEKGEFVEFSKDFEGFVNLSLEALLEALQHLFPPPVVFGENERTDKYDFLCNSYMCGFKLRGKEWKSMVHWFEASKFRGRLEEEDVRTAMDTDSAIDIASHIPNVNKEFESVKKKVMLEGLLAKFKQNEDLKEQLLSTGNSVIIFSSKDEYWGCGKEMQGKNFLGRILMDVRSKILQEQIPKLTSTNRTPLTLEPNYKFDDKGKEELN